jgi:hypothetical protein
MMMVTGRVPSDALSPVESVAAPLQWMKRKSPDEGKSGWLLRRLLRIWHRLLASLRLLLGILPWLAVRRLLAILWWRLLALSTPFRVILLVGLLLSLRLAVGRTQNLCVRLFTVATQRGPFRRLLLLLVRLLLHVLG